MKANPATKMTYPQKMAMSFIVFIIAAAALIFLAIIPFGNEIIKMKTDAESQAAEIEKDYFQGKSLKKVAADLKVVQPQIEQLDQIFINKNDALDFVTSLEKTAEKNGVTLQEKLGSEDDQGKFYTVIPLTISVSGNFSGVMNYLSDVESFSQYLNIKSMELTAAAPVSGQKNITMQILADTYWLP
ncbi:MAG TPA: type 4a pilus biogenesis protein PilO [Candidatus Methylomirabilis sp.]|nr:type 4a pilus biogenesis protein PilO [Candidatus Methylomirabilis sp.]